MVIVWVLFGRVPIACTSTSQWHPSGVRSLSSTSDGRSWDSDPQRVERWCRPEFAWGYAQGVVPLHDVINGWPAKVDDSQDPVVPDSDTEHSRDLAEVRHFEVTRNVGLELCHPQCRVRLDSEVVC